MPRRGSHSNGFYLRAPPQARTQACGDEIETPHLGSRRLHRQGLVGGEQVHAVVVHGLGQRRSQALGEGFEVPGSREVEPEGRAVPVIARGKVCLEHGELQPLVHGHAETKFPA